MDNVYKDMNVRQKLAKARLLFLNRKVVKSGKNMHLEFKYFELEDIVPAAIRIFDEVGLTSFTYFDGERASMVILNTEDPEDLGITFTIPYRENKPIISSKGAEVTNVMQCLGSSVTYLRRYLWMMALDITEPDEVDANLGSDDGEGEEAEIPAPNPETAKKEKGKKKAPATTAERKAAKKDMTNTDGPADELQITALKNVCKALMEKDEAHEDLVQKIAMKTQGFTTITRSACEQLINNLGGMIAEYDKEG